MRNITYIRLAFVLAAIFGLSMAASASSGAAQSKTLDNLLAAYNGESNAHAKYLEYAKKADAEGYGKVASLFRAAASNDHIRHG
jgi:hypothetical protein